MHSGQRQGSRSTSGLRQDPRPDARYTEELEERVHVLEKSDAKRARAEKQRDARLQVRRLL
jgi:hypothetical protein